MSPRSTRRLLVPLFLLARAGTAAPEDFALSRAGAPPEVLAPALLEAIDASGVRIDRGGSSLATFWLRRKLPLPAASPGPSSPVLADRVLFRSVPAAALLGVVAFDRPWLDYRNAELPAGVYTMRYAVQPAMKEHRDVSVYRDFAILTPVALDRDLNRDPAEILASSIRAFGRGHPAVLAIFPLAGVLSGPRVAENSLGQPVLAVPLGPVEMGLVLQGHGKLDGSI